MNSKQIYEVIQKLTGPIEAHGESNRDSQNLENLKTLTNVVDMIITDISRASKNITRHESSMKAIGSHAQEYLIELRKEIKEGINVNYGNERVC